MNIPNYSFFNVHHSPVGAFASFTLGEPDRKGGLGLQLEGPANENILIGIKRANGNVYEVLPFFEEGEDESQRYQVNGSIEGEGSLKTSRVRSYARESITRKFSIASDTWNAGDLSFPYLFSGKGCAGPQGWFCEGTEEGNCASGFC